MGAFNIPALMRRGINPEANTAPPMISGGGMAEQYLPPMEAPGANLGMGNLGANVQGPRPNKFLPGSVGAAGDMRAREMPNPILPPPPPIYGSVGAAIQGQRPPLDTNVQPNLRAGRGVLGGMRPGQRMRDRTNRGGNISMF